MQLVYQWRGRRHGCSSSLLKWPLREHISAHLSYLRWRHKMKLLAVSARLTCWSERVPSVAPARSPCVCVLRGPKLSGLYLDVTCFRPDSAQSCLPVTFSLPTPVNKVLLVAPWLHSAEVISSDVNEARYMHASAFICRAYYKYSYYCSFDAPTFLLKGWSSCLTHLRLFFPPLNVLLCDWYWFDNRNQ